MSKIYKTAIIEKRNVLNELRSNNMTVQELRFFSIYLSKINPRDISTRTVRFPLEDFQRIMGFGRLNIGQLKESVNSLLCKVVSIPNERGGFTSFQLFKECTVDKDNMGEWYVEIDAHDKALPLMFDFKTRYFKYELWNALRLKSSNQVRMYEILKQYEVLGKRELSVQELRELLGIGENEYPRWEAFKRRVLDSCQQALKESTDICYTYERGKVGNGGKWLTIVFYIKKNKDYVDQLSLDEFIEMQPNPEPIMLDTTADDELEGQLTMEEITFTDERLVPFAKACNMEFSEAELKQILDVLHSKGKDNPEYLGEQYQKMCAESEKRKVNSRSAYLMALIKNDKTSFKKKKKQQESKGEPSYDINEWTKMAENIDLEALAIADFGAIEQIEKESGD
jgi:acyl-CoA-binding protein